MCCSERFEVVVYVAMPHCCLGQDITGLMLVNEREFVNLGT